ARAQLLDRADRRIVYAPRHRGIVLRAGAVPADRLRLVANDCRTDVGASGAGDDPDETDDRSVAEAVRLPPAAAHQHDHGRHAAGGVRVAASVDAGLGGGAAGIRVRVDDVAAVHFDEHAGVRGPAAGARGAGLVVDLGGAVPRDDVRHRLRVA